MIGIIGAMDEEVEQIVAVMDIKKEETKACMTFKAGILAGKDLVIVRSGIGKVNAAFAVLISGHYPSIAIYLLFSTALLSFLGTTSLKIPSSYLALMSSCVTPSPT